MEQNEKTQEAEYRRGYQDGYLVALNNIATMMFNMHIPPKEAINTCHDHGVGRLSRWMREEPTKTITAPEPSLWQPESQYDQHPQYMLVPRIWFFRIFRAQQ